MNRLYDVALRRRETRFAGRKNKRIVVPKWEFHGMMSIGVSARGDITACFKAESMVRSSRTHQRTQLKGFGALEHIHRSDPSSADREQTIAVWRIESDTLYYSEPKVLQLDFRYIAGCRF